MVKPWELPWANAPHQAVPSTGGTWRAPAPLSMACKGALAGMGIQYLEPFADGSARFHVQYDAALQTDIDYGDLENPAYRAMWIAGRLAAGKNAMVVGELLHDLVLLLRKGPAGPFSLGHAMLGVRLSCGERVMYRLEQSSLLNLHVRFTSRRITGVLTDRGVSHQP